MLLSLWLEPSQTLKLYVFEVLAPCCLPESLPSHSGAHPSLLFFFSSIKKEQKNWKQNIKILPQNSWEGLNENLLRWKAHQIKFQAQEKKENNTPPKKTSPKNPVTSNGAIYTSSWKKPRKLVNSKHEFVKQKSLYIIKFFDDYNGICALGRNNCY